MPINVYATKSGWINSASTAFNYGRQQTMKVYSSYYADKNGSLVLSDLTVGRIVLGIPQSIVNYDIQKAYLVLTDVQHAYPTKDTVTLKLYTMNNLTFTEGSEYGRSGFCNFISATENAGTQWQKSDGLSQPQITLDTVSQNVVVDVTDMVNNWKRQPGVYDSMHVIMSNQTIQNGYRAYKSRHATDKLFCPKFVIYERLSSSTAIVDNSMFMKCNDNNTIYYKNFYKGQLTDLSGTANPFTNVSIVGTSGGIEDTIYNSMSRYRVSKGVYAASGTLPSTASIYQSASAKWSIAGVGSVYTQVNIIGLNSSLGQISQQISFMIRNKKNYYKKDQKILLKPILYKYKNIRKLDGDSTTKIPSDKMYCRVKDYKTQNLVFDWFEVQLYGRQNYVQLDLNNVFHRDDQTKYELVFQFKVQDVYGQTIRFGQNLTDNCTITVI